ncbi:MAG: head-tail joining protein [Phycisphaerae bacterium]
MSAFDDLMKDMGRPLLMEQLGRPVVYKAIDTDEQTITAAVGEIRTEIVQDEGHRSDVMRRTITISLADVTHPQTHDCIEVEPGDSWVVVGVEIQNNGLASLLAESTRKTRVTRPGYDRGR